MSNELPYCPWFVSDILVTVATWPRDRVGAYALALWYQFEHGGIDADNLQTLGLVLHAKSRQDTLKAWDEIRAKFEKRDDGLYWNARLEEVRAEAIREYYAKQARAKAGAAARWGRGNLARSARADATARANGDAQASPQAMPTKTKTSTTPPNPPSAKGGNPRRPTRRSLKTADPFDQRAKTEEFQRLVAGGMDRAEAHRKAFS